jgi:hypothetical protein
MNRSESGRVIGRATQLYEEAISLGGELLRMFVPYINSGTPPSTPHDFSQRTTYKMMAWSDWPDALVARAKVYPYV